jgi:hypothetical protein
MLVLNSRGETTHSIIMFSKILSLEASFQDKPSIILAWQEINSLKGG